MLVQSTYVKIQNKMRVSSKTFYSRHFIIFYWLITFNILLQLQYLKNLIIAQFFYIYDTKMVLAWFHHTLPVHLVPVFIYLLFLNELYNIWVGKLTHVSWPTLLYLYILCWPTLLHVQVYIWFLWFLNELYYIWVLNLVGCLLIHPAILIGRKLTDRKNSRLWPGARVPYEFADTVDHEEQSADSRKINAMSKIYIH